MFPLVYEINTRIWLRQLSEYYNQPITLGSVPDSEFSFFAQCNFDIIWLMGVWQPSKYSNAIATSHPSLRKGFLAHVPHDLKADDITASPYSIPTYTINDALGGNDELLAFRARLHRIGIKLMLDFVPNHLALDNEWLPEHPEFFMPLREDEHSQDPNAGFEYVANSYLAYGKDPYFAPWTDTLQLNYANLATHDMMTENLMKIGALADAVRCDVAMLILKSVFNTTWSSLGGQMHKEFWFDAISSVKKRYHDMIFLAEAYWNKEWELQMQGFDFTYDKPYYDYVTNAPVVVDKLSGHLSGGWDYQQKLCRFLENHDEPRSAAKLGLNNRAAAVVLLTTPGMHLIHQQQMVGYKKQMPVQLLRQAVEPEDGELAALYEQLFALQTHEVFQHGGIEWLDLNVCHYCHCFGFRRYHDEKNAFVIVNFSPFGMDLTFSHAALENMEGKALHTLSSTGKLAENELSVEGRAVKVTLSPHEALVMYN
uniref:Alpha amylase, catalytic subdomain n=1 Tax=Chlorobium chlorochromatii (strain CaD3) TaxID=340177 RepID=Q3AQQ1_CHLCH